ncbi:hypothetical protein N9166_00100, partial [bacterium]|nr:hypothetical protein [bacterium]
SSTEWSRRTELVRLHPSEDPRQIIFENRNAVISCPLDDLLAFAKKPRPLVPIQARDANHDPEGWSSNWLRFADRIASELEHRTTYTTTRHYTVVDLLHAGLCGVVDKRSGQRSPSIVVIVLETTRGRGSGGREFHFEDGLGFLAVLDWIE